MVSRTYLTLRIILIVSLAVGYLPATQITEDYIGPASGNWNTPGNWSPNLVTLVPDNGNGGNTYTVHIANTPNAMVSLDISVTLDNLKIDVGDALAINDGQALLINGNGNNAGAIVNNGVITLGSTGNSTNLIVTGANVMLSGTGNITTSNNGLNFITAGAAG